MDEPANDWQPDDYEGLLASEACKTDRRAR